MNNNKYFNSFINKIIDGLGKLKGLKVFLLITDDQGKSIVLYFLVGWIAMLDIEIVNGGDQNNNSIQEVPICNQLKIELVDYLGVIIHSSSWLSDD
ncbi:hypothetical protein [Flavobacterium sp.]|uniref:hypothetical protein n=1 Tax=Flavobacterium sp. TaxID=239 RepID=UPI0037BEBFAD